MNRLGIAIMLLAAGTLFAAPEQEQKSAPGQQKPVWAGREFEIKHLDAERARRAVSLAQNMYDTRITYEPSLRRGVIQAAPADLPQVEAFLKRLDVPEPAQRQFALTIYVLDASPNTSQSASLPSEIEPAAKEIRAAFPYKGFRLLDTVLLQGMWRSNVSGTLAKASGDAGAKQPYLYNANYGGVNLSSGDTAELENFHFGVKVPVTTSNVVTVSDVGIDSARLSIRRGQKLVLGKVTVGLDDSAIFLVLTADIK